LRAGAAVANAVFNGTGVRLRHFPITLDKVLPGCRSWNSESHHSYQKGGLRFGRASLDLKP
jgi:hypothetical protein